MINFPYGISNFARIRSYPYLYLDRTQLIPTLEAAGEQLLFLRPRRFGKSLWLSTLANYYDINQAEQFEALFGDLSIGNNPTEEHSSYMILRWDFSKVSAQGDVDQIKQSLFNHINATVKSFSYQYSSQLRDTINVNVEDALDSFQSVLDVVKASGHQVYLLIDEYDNFANEVLMHNQGDKARYLALLEGEGILKTLFKFVKAGASESKISRVFITGVSPVVMSDMTSGYNVATNISLKEEFATLCGITEDELSSLVEQVVDDPKEKESKHLQVMTTLRQSYNGYRFSFSEQVLGVYNPILCFHFLRSYQENQQPPRKMLDGNLASDKAVIRYIAQLKGGQSVIDGVLDKEEKIALPDLAECLSITDLRCLEWHGDYMLSLLYYCGLLTLNGLDDFGRFQLSIPNLVTRTLYLDELKHQTLPNLTEDILVFKGIEDFPAFESHRHDLNDSQDDPFA